MHACIHTCTHTYRERVLFIGSQFSNLYTYFAYIHTYIHTYIHMNVIRSACSNVILIYRDVRTCTELCVIKSVYIADSTVCTSCTAGKFSTAVGATSVATCSNCDAGKYSATAGVESVCVVCVFVSFQKKKAGYIHTLSHTIHT